MYKSLNVANNAHNLNEIAEEYSNRGSFVDISVQDKDDASSCSLVTGSRGVDKVAIHVGFDPRSIQIYDFLANLGIMLFLHVLYAKQAPLLTHAIF